MVFSILVCKNCGAINQQESICCHSCGLSLSGMLPTIYDPVTGQLRTNIVLKQRYRVLAPIGKGGMGTVYRAEDTRLGNRQVALKEMRQSGLKPEEQKAATDAFNREALILARLQHPNLPSIFDHFEEHGRWYLVMSFIEGATLDTYLRGSPGGKLSQKEVVQIGEQLCNVLSYLHNQKPAIIFRDLKPGNIMRMSDGHIYLIDFGIARHFKPGQAKDTAFYVSLGYAPPEQYGKTQTTPRSDIYSLGVVLHQMLSGHNPSTTLFRLPPLQLLVPTLPMELAALITSMLDLDENKRPASVLVVGQELRRLATTAADLSHATEPLPATETGMAPLRASDASLPVGTRRKRSLLMLIAGTVGVILVLGMLSLAILRGGLASFAFSSQALSNGNPRQMPSMFMLPHPTPSTVSYPRLATAYQGTAHNVTLDVTTTLALSSIVQNQQAISGQVIVGPGLKGNGPFTGTIGTDGSVHFIDDDTADGFTIVFRGQLSPDGLLSGTYEAPGSGEHGVWQATPA